MVTQRRLSAILAADVVGFSRMMGADEAGTLAALKSVRSDLVEKKIAEHHGRIFKLTGDGILAEFPSVVNAVACAVQWQQAMALSTKDQIQFRIGVSLGDVMVEGDDIYGDGVNVAARLESIAPAGGIAISQSVRDHVGNRLKLSLEDLGEQELKNIATPIRVYLVSVDEAQPNETSVMKHERPSIAVLPFNNMSGDPEQEYFSDGITEDIITDLSKVSGLYVAARNSTFTYKGKAVKVQHIGKELGVGHVLEGSVRKAGARVRVTGQLINVKDGGHVWAERFDRDLTDIFAIQDEITHAIVEQLKVKLLPVEKQSISQTPTDNIEAYTYYLRGRDFFYRHSKRYFELARRMFVKAVELDPNYARAYAGIADCDSWLYMTYRLDVPITRLLEMSAKALALDPNLPEAHASMGVALTAAQRYEEAAVEFDRAITLDPTLFHAHMLYARSNVMRGNLEKATQLFERASELKPDDFQSQCLLIGMYRSLGRHDSAMEAARKGIARAENELALHPDDARPAVLGSAALIHLGETDRARDWLARALAIEPDDPLTLYNVACGSVHMGEFDRAMDLLERVLATGGPHWADWLAHDSDLDPLRELPRYQNIRAAAERLRDGAAI